jgi:hypothetical protein
MMLCMTWHIVTRPVLAKGIESTEGQEAYYRKSHARIVITIRSTEMSSGKSMADADDIDGKRFDEFDCTQS